MFGFRFQNTQSPQLWVIPISFACLIIVGTILFKMPFAIAPGHTLNWIDSFFVATSAVSITGLSPISVGEVFTFPGQVILLCLIQLGALGIFTASLIMVVVAGQRFSMADEQIIQVTLGRIRTVKPLDIFLYACFFMAFFELLGFLFYFSGAVNVASEVAGFEQDHSLIWTSIFHGVSSFCNAGFCLYPEGFAHWKNSPYFLSLLGILGIFGSIGLMTLINIRYWYFWKKDSTQRRELTLQTRINLMVYGALLFFGGFLFFCFEYNHTLEECNGLWLKIVTSFYHSAMARSCGGNSVDLADADPGTLFCYLGLMFIGGCSGSMAGGIKVTTFFLILISAWNVLKRNEQIQLFQKQIPQKLVHVALMIAFLFVLVLFFGIFILLILEDNGPAVQQKQGWLGIIFEAFSAFCTVGLSTGVTSTLTWGGKLVLIVMMFVGRIITLTLAVYLLRPQKKAYIRYPEEQIALG